MKPLPDKKELDIMYVELNNIKPPVGLANNGVWFTCIFERENIIDKRKLLDAMHSIVPQPHEPDSLDD